MQPTCSQTWQPFGLSPTYAPTLTLKFSLFNWLITSHAFTSSYIEVGEMRGTTSARPTAAFTSGSTSLTSVRLKLSLDKGEKRIVDLIRDTGMVSDARIDFGKV